MSPVPPQKAPARSSVTRLQTFRAICPKFITTNNQASTKLLFVLTSSLTPHTRMMLKPLGKFNADSLEDAKRSGWGTEKNQGYIQGPQQAGHLNSFDFPPSSRGYIPHACMIRLSSCTRIYRPIPNTKRTYMYRYNPIVFRD